MCLNFQQAHSPAVRAVTQPQDWSLTAGQPQDPLISTAFSVTVKQWGVAFKGKENLRKGLEEVYCCVLGMP